MERTAETQNNKISVLMSVYKKEKPEYLKAALESILAQTRQADEILLIEDGPLTDELYEVVAQYEKKCDFLRVYAIKENVQLGRALAKGVELCRYGLIARMDTDDIAMPDRLEKEGAYMQEHPEVDVVGGFIREFNDEGTIDRVKKMPLSQQEILEYVKFRNPLNHMTVMYRRDAVLKAGNYKHFPFLEDYSLWSRMLSEGYQFRNMEEILVRARTSMSLVRRRSGLAYYKNFRELRRQQHQLGLTNTYEYGKAIAGTFVMIMLPGWVKEYSYRKFLRQSKK